MPKQKEIKANVSIENAQIQFRNFRGKEGKYNREGVRSFCVFLDPEDAAPLLEDGWNIKELQPKDPGDHPQPYLQVGVAFGNFPPKIVVMSESGSEMLEEETVHSLDWAEFENVDMTIRPYNWQMSGKTGVKAYLKTMYVKIVEDDIERKYRDVPSTVAPDDDLED